MSGMMCPVKTVGNPGICTSHMCKETILRLSGNVTEIGDMAGRLLRHGAFLVKNNDVAPVAATATASCSGHDDEMLACIVMS